MCISMFRILGKRTDFWLSFLRKRQRQATRATAQIAEQLLQMKLLYHG